MSWLQSFFGQSNPDPLNARNAHDPRYWGNVGHVAGSGVVVDEDAALSISAYWAAMSVISSAIAGVPLILYQLMPDGTKDRAYNQHLYGLLHDQPNDAQTAFEWREYLMLCAMGWGNGYSEILPGPNGFIDQIDVPFHPSQVTPKINANKRRIIYYEITNADGTSRKIQPEQMFHVRGMSKDGLVGMSIFRYARESLGLALATESYGSRFFSQDATPRGVLSHPGSFEENSTAPARIRSEWEEMHSGLNNAHKVAVLEEGMTFQSISIPNEDAQFLQTRQFTVREIARWFSIQPHMIQDLQNATFTNIEAQGQEFVTYTLTRWAKRWEQTIQMRLIGEQNQQLYAKHLFDALMRGDTLARYQVYAIARAIGVMNPDEIRAKEDLNPRSDGKGDDYEAPIQRRETIKEDDPANTVPVGASYSDLDIVARSNGYAPYTGNDRD